MKYYLKALQNYAVFTGRASRKEYWYFVLFSFLALIFLSFIEGLFRSLFDFSIVFLYPIFMLSMIVPSLAVLVRRLHDIGKSGTWFFIYFVPVVGGIWLIILLATESDFGKNKYGPHPDQNSTGDLYSDILDSDDFFVGNEPMPQERSSFNEKPSGQTSFTKGVYSRSSENLYRKD